MSYNSPQLPKFEQYNQDSNSYTFTPSQLQNSFQVKSFSDKPPPFADYHIKFLEYIRQKYLNTCKEYNSHPKSPPSQGQFSNINNSKNLHNQCELHILLAFGTYIAIYDAKYILSEIEETLHTTLKIYRNLFQSQIQLNTLIDFFKNCLSEKYTSYDHFTQQNSLSSHSLFEKNNQNDQSETINNNNNNTYTNINKQPVLSLESLSDSVFATILKCVNYLQTDMVKFHLLQTPPSSIHNPSITSYSVISSHIPLPATQSIISSKPTTTTTTATTTVGVESTGLPTHNILVKNLPTVSSQTSLHELSLKNSQDVTHQYSELTPAYIGKNSQPRSKFHEQYHHQQDNNISNQFNNNTQLNLDNTQLNLNNTQLDLPLPKNLQLDDTHENHHPQMHATTTTTTTTSIPTTKTTNNTTSTPIVNIGGIPGSPLASSGLQFPDAPTSEAHYHQYDKQHIYPSPSLSMTSHMTSISRHIMIADSSTTNGVLQTLYADRLHKYNKVCNIADIIDNNEYQALIEQNIDKKKFQQSQQQQQQLELQHQEDETQQQCQCPLMEPASSCVSTFSTTQQQTQQQQQNRQRSKHIPSPDTILSYKYSKITSLPSNIDDYDNTLQILKTQFQSDIFNYYERYMVIKDGIKQMLLIIPQWVHQIIKEVNSICQIFRTKVHTSIQNFNQLHIENPGISIPNNLDPLLNELNNQISYLNDYYHQLQQFCDESNVNYQQDMKLDEIIKLYFIDNNNNNLWHDTISTSTTGSANLTHNARYSGSSTLSSSALSSQIDINNNHNYFATHHNLLKIIIHTFNNLSNIFKTSIRTFINVVSSIMLHISNIMNEIKLGYDSIARQYFTLLLKFHILVQNYTLLLPNHLTVSSQSYDTHTPTTNVELNALLPLPNLFQQQQQQQQQYLDNQEKPRDLPYSITFFLAPEDILQPPHLQNQNLQHQQQQQYQQQHQQQQQQQQQQQRFECPGQISLPQLIETQQELKLDEYLIRLHSLLTKCIIYFPFSQFLSIDTSQHIQSTYPINNITQHVYIPQNIPNGYIFQSDHIENWFHKVQQFLLSPASLPYRSIHLSEHINAYYHDIVFVQWFQSCFLTINNKITNWLQYLTLIPSLEQNYYLFSYNNAHNTHTNTINHNNYNYDNTNNNIINNSLHHAILTIIATFSSISHKLINSSASMLPLSSISSSTVLSSPIYNQSLQTMVYSGHIFNDIDACIHPSEPKDNVLFNDTYSVNSSSTVLLDTNKSIWEYLSSISLHLEELLAYKTKHDTDNDDNDDDDDDENNENVDITQINSYNKIITDSLYLEQQRRQRTIIQACESINLLQQHWLKQLSGEIKTRSTNLIFILSAILGFNSRERQEICQNPPSDFINNKKIMPILKLFFYSQEPAKLVLKDHWEVVKQQSFFLLHISMHQNLLECGLYVEYLIHNHPSLSEMCNIVGENDQTDGLCTSTSPLVESSAPVSLSALPPSAAVAIPIPAPPASISTTTSIPPSPLGFRRQPVQYARQSLTLATFYYKFTQSIWNLLQCYNALWTLTSTKQQQQSQQQQQQSQPQTQTQLSSRSSTYASTSFTHSQISTIHSSFDEHNVLINGLYELLSDPLPHFLITPVFPSLPTLNPSVNHSALYSINDSRGMLSLSNDTDSNDNNNNTNNNNEFWSNVILPHYVQGYQMGSEKYNTVVHSNHPLRTVQAKSKELHTATAPMINTPCSADGSVRKNTHFYCNKTPQSAHYYDHHGSHQPLQRSQQQQHNRQQHQQKQFNTIGNHTVNDTIAHSTYNNNNYHYNDNNRYNNKNLNNNNNNNNNINNTNQYHQQHAAFNTLPTPNHPQNVPKSTSSLSNQPDGELIDFQPDKEISSDFDDTQQHHHISNNERDDDDYNLNTLDLNQTHNITMTQPASQISKGSMQTQQVSTQPQHGMGDVIAIGVSRGYNYQHTAGSCPQVGGVPSNVGASSRVPSNIPQQHQHMQYNYHNIHNNNNNNQY